MTSSLASRRQETREKQFGRNDPNPRRTSGSGALTIPPAASAAAGYLTRTPARHRALAVGAELAVAARAHARRGPRTHLHAAALPLVVGQELAAAPACTRTPPRSCWPLGRSSPRAARLEHAHALPLPAGELALWGAQQGSLRAAAGSHRDPRAPPLRRWAEAHGRRPHEWSSQPRAKIAGRKRIKR
jgi:hypothetical protein